MLARFDGGAITGDAGPLLTAQADRTLGLIDRMCAGITDRRDQSKVPHTLLEFVRSRIYSIATGYEDANDLDTRTDDAGLRVACGRSLTAAERPGSQPTISRMEHAVSQRDLVRTGRILGQQVVDALPAGTRQIVVDMDPSEDPGHGQQELEFFNGHYSAQCYLPLFLHVAAEDGTQRLLAALLRSGKAEAKQCLFALLRRSVKKTRGRVPGVRIIPRGDAAFGNVEAIDFCRRMGVDYILGLETNKRINELAAAQEAAALVRVGDSERPARCYSESSTWRIAGRAVSA